MPAAYGVSAVDRCSSTLTLGARLKVKPLMDDLIDWLTLRRLLPHPVHRARGVAPDERSVNGVGIPSPARGTKVSYLSLAT